MGPGVAAPALGSATEHRTRVPAAPAAAAVAVLAGLIVLAVVASLSGDVQYALGGLRATEGSESFLTTFVHRPLAYRAALAALDAPARAVGLGPGSLVAYEAVLRLAAIAAAAAAGWCLWWALRRHLPRIDAATVSGAVGMALALPPTWDVLQPDWMGGMFVALAVAAALGPKRAVLAGILAGLCVVLAVGVKLATISLAPLAFILVWAVDRRRAGAMAVGAVVWGVGWLAVMLLALPIEWQWVRDMAALNPNSPIRSGLDARDRQLLLNAIGSKIVLQPWLIIVPPAIVLLARAAGSLRGAGGLATLVVAALAMAVAPIIIQGQYYLYHLAALGPAAAAVVALAVARWWRLAGRPPMLLVAPLPLLGLAGALVLSQPPATREAWDRPVLLGCAALAVALSTWAAMPRLRPGRQASDRAHVRLHEVAWLAAAALAILPAVVPTAAWALDPAATTWTNAGWAMRSATKHVAYAELRRMIGADTPVLYLAYGDVPYHLGNPTDCRYPSPLWVQRGMDLAYVTQFASYRDNRNCLASPVPRYLVLQPHWFAIDRLQPTVRDVLDARYDCSAALVVDDLAACPRRS